MVAKSFGRYRIYGQIARGGMANVYLASPLDAVSAAELIVIKRIRPEFADDPSFVRMFIDEARITRQLNHPNIACLIDWGELDKIPYLVMEFVPGINLKRVLELGPLPPHLVAEIGIALARALDYAHERANEEGEPLGIVHRDVTPHNVMLTFTGEVKLLDFGIALARVRAEKTETGVLKGKWSYMSPEQIEGRTVDRRSDVFALGVLLYEMLAGRRAFEGESAPDILSAVVMKPPPSLYEGVPGLPLKLIQIVDDCIEKEPHRRFQKAREVAAALEQVRDELVDSMRMQSLVGFLEKSFPKRKGDISEVLAHIEDRLEQGELGMEPEQDATVVEAVPFMELSGDLEGRAGPLLPAVEVWRDPGASGKPQELLQHVEPAGAPPSPDRRVPLWLYLLAILLGLSIGGGVVFAIWFLGLTP